MWNTLHVALLEFIKKPKGAIVWLSWTIKFGGSNAKSSTRDSRKD